MKVAFRKWQVEYGLSWHKCWVPFWCSCVVDIQKDRAVRWALDLPPLLHVLGMLFVVCGWIPSLLLSFGIDLVTLPFQLYLRRCWKKQAKHAAAVAKALREANEPAKPKPLPNWPQWAASPPVVGMVVGGFVGWAYGRYKYSRAESYSGAMGGVGAVIGGAMGVLAESIERCGLQTRYKKKALPKRIA